MSPRLAAESRAQTRVGGVARRRRGTPDEIVVLVESARLPTLYGEFAMIAYRDGKGLEHLLLRMGCVDRASALVRIHSECLTGDALGSTRCDCGEQLQASLRYIAQEERGILLYLRQEGRGIGLANKVRAYALQDQGMDTVEANLHLGFPVDSRSYRIGALMLRDQGITGVRLLTNNPEKIAGLEESGIRVVEQVPHRVVPGAENHRYLQTKADKLGHILGSRF
jgi:GTP cyclohydrolase II